MINLHNARIDQLSVHRVGNKSRNEHLIYSKKEINLNDEYSAILKEFFLKNFREKEETYYNFHHEADLHLHDLYDKVTQMIDTPERSHDISKEIANWLYESSNHQHIKSGEIYVANISGLVIDNEKVNGVGIFKSEMQQDFIIFDEQQDDLDMRIIQGINTAKLDKGCLIFNVEKENGYKILSVDTNRYDTKYWTEQFLQIQLLQDNNFFTKHYLKFCQNFAKDVVLPTEDKQQEVLFMNKAVNHFAKNNDFQEEEFINDVIEKPDLIPQFKMYKEEKGPKYNVEDVSSFPIANETVNSMRKSIKNTISLDTNVQIKMDFVNEKSAEKVIEKGWDEERGMYYYLVYFNREKKS